jgi:hypothetical protein
VEKYGAARQAKYGNIIRRRKDAICMPDNQGKNKDTQTMKTREIFQKFPCVFIDMFFVEHPT